VHSSADWLTQIETL